MTTEEMLVVLRGAGNLTVTATEHFIDRAKGGWMVHTDTPGVCAWARLFGHAVSKAYQRYLNQGDKCVSAAK